MYKFETLDCIENILAMAVISKDARFPAAIRGRVAVTVHRHLSLLYHVLATARLPSSFPYFCLVVATFNIRLPLPWDHISLTQMRAVYFSNLSAAQPCWHLPGAWPLSSLFWLVMSRLETWMRLWATRGFKLSGYIWDSQILPDF